MKHKKRISRLRIQNRIEEKKQYKNGERKSIWGSHEYEYEGMSMADRSIIGAAAHSCHIVLWKMNGWKRLLLVLSTVVTFVFSGAIN